MDPLLKCLENHRKIHKLLKEDSKEDPPVDPYRSRYKAIELIIESLDLISRHLETLNSSDVEFHLFKSIFSSYLGQLGNTYIETEEHPKAEKCFMECLESVSDSLHSDNIIVSIQVRNQLGYLWSHRSQPLEAKKWLEEAEKLYFDYRKSTEKAAIYIFESDEKKEIEGEKELEQAHTLTKFYLAQVYGALKDILKSAVYCHETLRRELLYGIYNDIEWALNSATLSQVFMERLLFKQARHHLAAASHVLDKYEQTLENLTESQEAVEAKKEELRHRSADVSRCWAKYGIFLLEYSKNEEEKPEEKHQDLENLWFESLDLSLYENQITDQEVVAFEDAREVFLITQKHLNKAKEYYTLEERASDHVQIVQDHSQLFRHLTTFESDGGRQFKMMKKRVDMMETVLKELNPRYYLDVCRQLWFELGETYHDMMQLKYDKVKDSKEPPAPTALIKVNALIEASIKHFTCFLDSVKDKKSQEIPADLPEHLAKPTLIAHFYLGRLHHKYVTPDKRKQLEKTNKAYDCFKALVDVCEKNGKAASSLFEELSISKEMMNLLSVKALQI